MAIRVTGATLQRRHGLGGRGDFPLAARPLTEGHDIDVRRLDAERRDDGADLAAVVRAVVEHLRQPDAAGRVTRHPDAEG